MAGDIEGPSGEATLGVVCHENKSLDHAPAVLREALYQRIGDRFRWRGVTSSSDVPDAVRDLGKRPLERLLVWGGDGTVRHAVEAVVADDLVVDLAIMPTGTANLLCRNMGIPIDFDAALDVALNGVARPIDIGIMNGEPFTVMGGTGFDARLMARADRGLKNRFGRLGYVLAGLTQMGHNEHDVVVTVDGRPCVQNRASCVLVCNVGTILGGIDAFPCASPSDGQLDIGIARATSRLDWIRILVRAAFGRHGTSPLVTISRGESIEIDYCEPVIWEVDGGHRDPQRRFRVECLPAAVRVLQPPESVLQAVRS